MECLHGRSRWVFMSEIERVARNRLSGIEPHAFQHASDRLRLAFVHLIDRIGKRQHRVVGARIRIGSGGFEGFVILQGHVG